MITGVQQIYQVEVWRNAEFNGTPFLNTPNTPLSQQKITASANWKRVVYATVSSAATVYTILGSQLSDSIAYVARVRIINSPDTSSWATIPFYRNSPPQAPSDPITFIRSQNDLEYTGIAGADTATFPIFKWWKTTDFELDTLTYGFVVYTDSLTNNSDSTKAKTLIATQLRIRKWIGSGDTYKDTLKTSLAAYENYGIWWKAIATDGVDTSAGSEWGRYLLDAKNEAPNSFDLIAPANGNAAGVSPQFVWKNNGDPDPFTGKTFIIQKVEIWADTAVSFTSSNLKKFSYLTQDKPEIKNDTIKLTVDQTLLNHKRYFWKVNMFDYGRDANIGFSVPLSRVSNQTWSVYTDNGTNAAPSVPSLISPLNNEVVQSSLLKFLWKKSVDAENDSIFYSVRIASDENMSSVLATKTDITNSGDTVNISLSDILGVVTLTQGKTYYWDVRANDRFGGVSQFSQIKGKFFYDAKANTSPTITSHADTLAYEDSLYKYQAVANEPDQGDSVVYSLTLSPAWLSISKSGLVSGVPKALNLGDTAFVLYATDMHGASDMQIVKLHVVHVNHPPTPARLFTPAKNDTVVLTLQFNPLQFVWRKSVDADTVFVKDTLRYILTLKGSNVDTTVLVKIDTTIKIDIAKKLTLSSFYTWTIKTFDGLATVASPDTFAFFIKSGTSGVSDNASEIPKEFSLAQNFPNPFNPTTTIQFGLPKRSNVELYMYDLLGKEIMSVVFGPLDAGFHSYMWNASAFSSGIYFYRLIAKAMDDDKKQLFIMTKKLILMK